MGYNSTIDLFNAYTRAYNVATLDSKVEAPTNMTRQSYMAYVNNPDRVSQDITEEEYAQIMKVIEEGEQSSDSKVREMAEGIRKNLEIMADQSYSTRFGVTAEEFKNGNKGSYNRQLEDLNRREQALLKELQELDNASFTDKFFNLFTGELTKKRERIENSLMVITDTKDFLNAKITYNTILRTRFK